jgi:hypothetical protein
MIIVMEIYPLSLEVYVDYLSKPRGTHQVLNLGPLVQEFELKQNECPGGVIS